MGKKVAMVSLGCAKNQVDAEQMLCLLHEAGYEITTEVEYCDVAIVNTCGFIESAKSEAIQEILELGLLKNEGKIGKILVSGCLSQRYKDQLMEELPEVDGILGCGSYGDIVSAVDDVLGGDKPRRFGDINADPEELGRVLTTPDYYAYLKIAEGCDNHCAFCVIPQLRGRYRSRKFEDLIDEAKILAANGVKELILIAQDTSRYGIDLYGKRRLSELLRNPIYVKADPSVLHFFQNQGTVICNPPEDFIGTNGCYFYRDKQEARSSASALAPGQKNARKGFLVLAPHEGIVPADLWLACQNPRCPRQPLTSCVFPDIPSCPVRGSASDAPG